MGKLTVEEVAHLRMLLRVKWDPHYSSRGIKVCERWLKFENFLADIGKKPRPYRQWTLERINNDGDYEPGNCVWATWKQQNNNKRSNRFVEIKGERMTVAQASRKYSLPAGTIHDRLKRGVHGDELIYPPPSKKEVARRRTAARVPEKKIAQLRGLHREGWSVTRLMDLFGWDRRTVTKLINGCPWWEI